MKQRKWITKCKILTQKADRLTKNAKRSFCALEMMALSCLRAPRNRIYCSAKHQKQKVTPSDMCSVSSQGRERVMVGDHPYFEGGGPTPPLKMYNCTLRPFFDLQEKLYINLSWMYNVRLRFLIPPGKNCT